MSTLANLLLLEEPWSDHTIALSGCILILKDDYVFGAVAVIDVIAVAATFCC